MSEGKKQSAFAPVNKVVNKSIRIICILLLMSVHFASAQESVHSSSEKTSVRQSTVVKGTVRNYAQETLYLGEEKLEIDSEGRFTIEVSVEEADYFPLKAGRQTFELYLEAGKELTLSFNVQAINESISFEGAGAPANSFLADMKSVSASFSNYFNFNQRQLYALPEQDYRFKIDSLRDTFVQPLEELAAEHPDIHPEFFNENRITFKYLFDRFLLVYPGVHERETNRQVDYSDELRKYLDQNDIDNTEYLKYPAYHRYVKLYLETEVNKEMKKEAYQSSNIRFLEASWKVIKRNFNSQETLEYWLYDQLKSYYDEYSIKGTNKILDDFNRQCQNQTYKDEINEIYSQAVAKRKDHVVKVYKQVDNYELDAHLFFPENDSLKDKPVMVYFHGGSWVKGKPDWGFNSSKAYAAKGWLGVAVEYRLNHRHGALMFDEIEDAKSIIRWLRLNAGELGINPERIVVSGNSVGANLALCTATIDTLDRAGEDLSVSSKPNAVMVNSVATDFTDVGPWHKYVEDYSVFETISPLHNISKDMPPMLIVHGTRDTAVPLGPTRDFVEKMKAAGNQVDFHEIEGAHHFIWLDRRFSGRVTKWRKAFLQEQGYSVPQI